MLKDDKQAILNENYLLNKRKDARTISRFLSQRTLIMVLGIVFGFVMIVFTYFHSSASNIFVINVRDNIYLKDEDVIRISGISERDKYLLTIPSLVEKKIKKDPLIKDAKVELSGDRVVQITIEEVKQIGYIYDNSLNYVLLEDENKILLDEKNMYFIEKLPFIEGYNAEQLSLIVKGFKNIDHLTIDQISEIHRYPFSYDENMMEIIMRDGNYCFVSWNGLKMLDKYYSIVSGLGESGKNTCIYLNELNNSGYAGACPWWEDDAIKQDAEENEQ